MLLAVAHRLTRRKLTAVALLFCSTAAYAANPCFNDVIGSDPYAQATATMFTRWITNGCSALPSLYCPGANLTRGEMAALLVRAIYSTLTGDGENFFFSSTSYFSDISPDPSSPDYTPFFRYIQRLKELNITNGVAPGIYCANCTLNYAQLAIFTVRARAVLDSAGLGGGPLTPPACPWMPFGDCTTRPSFTDFSDPIYQANAGWIENALRLVGPAIAPSTSNNAFVPPASFCPAGQFCPSNAASRGQIAINIDYGILQQTGPGSAVQIPAYLPQVMNLPRICSY